MEQDVNFGYLPKEYSNYEDAAIVIIPVPYDETSTWIKGAAKGPEAIIDASGNLELYDIETDSEVYKKGIFTDRAIDKVVEPAAMVDEVRKRAEGHINQGKFAVVIGGEHSVSIGSVRAHTAKYQNVTTLQLDAHSDLRQEYNGSKYNHACVMARIQKMCPIVQVGIRSMDINEKDSMDTSKVFFAKDIHNDGKWTDKVACELSDNVYITIDLDVFDPSFMSSVGTPEPGGLDWYDMIRLLKAVCDTKNVVGFDVVELCPNSNNRASDFTAAKLVYKLLSYKFRA